MRGAGRFARLKRPRRRSIRAAIAPTRRAAACASPRGESSGDFDFAAPSPALADSEGSAFGAARSGRRRSRVTAPRYKPRRWRGRKPEPPSEGVRISRISERPRRSAGAAKARLGSEAVHEAPEVALARRLAGVRPQREPAHKARELAFAIPEDRVRILTPLHAGCAALRAVAQCDGEVGDHGRTLPATRARFLWNEARGVTVN